MTTPQVTLFLDTSGALRAEAPGTNGHRCKVAADLSLSLNSLTEDDLLNLAHALINEIRTQAATEAARLAAEKKRQAALAAARHTQILTYAAAHYPSAIPLIDPGATRVPRKDSKLYQKLRRDGYAPLEIEAMAKAGHLVGTAFWTAPQPPASSNTSDPKKPGAARREGVSMAALRAAITAAI